MESVFFVLTNQAAGNEYRILNKACEAGSLADNNRIYSQISLPLLGTSF
jgi:hypothetical protein